MFQIGERERRLTVRTSTKVSKEIYGPITSKFSTYKDDESYSNSLGSRGEYNESNKDTRKSIIIGQKIDNKERRRKGKLDDDLCAVEMSFLVTNEGMLQ